MRYSEIFGKTLRQVPVEAECISHQLLLRSGMIAQTATGVYSYLPLGWRVLKKIEKLIREEINKAGGQELMLPVLQPFELWQKSGRDASFGQSLFSLTDRKDHKLVLGPTHEEVITELVHRNVQSYRDLPLLLYQIQTKFRDEPRPRGGLLRVREFIMKDLYSFDVDEAGLDESYEKMSKAYKNIYDRLGLPALMVEADSGAIGGKASHEFIVITESGEDEVLRCSECDYAANAEKAQSIKKKANEQAPLPLEEIATPEMKTIEGVADFLKLPTSQTIKAVFYSADSEFIFVIIRGDLEVNEIKLKNILKCSELRLATETEVDTAGIVAGYASPIGITGLKIVADDSIILGTNFVVGANRRGYHLKNANYRRDFEAGLIADIALTRAGDSCPKCGGKLFSARGIEVGHIFKLGTFVSEKMGTLFLDRDGISKPITMGCYGIGLGRLMAAVIEQSHDDKGIIWPTSIAPYQVHLCSLSLGKSEVLPVTEDIYNRLQEAGIDVLYDDRDDSAGIKFNDADLLGIPLRLTVSPRTLKQQSIEFKWRINKDSYLIALKDVVNEIKNAPLEKSASQTSP
jgi:prolyl-tRNA synthetase